MKTLKLLVLALLVCCSAYQLSAQTKIVPKVGFNLSALDADVQDFTAEARTGRHIGLDFRMGTKKLFFVPGVQYQSATARLMRDIDEDVQVDFSEETTIQSVKAPLNVGYRVLGLGKLLNLHVRGGIVPTYVMGVKETDNFDFSVDQLNRLTWGTNLGVGVDFLFLTADLSYEKGMTDFFAEGAGKNNVLSLSVGVKF